MINIRLANFIAPFKGNIKSEEISKLSVAAAGDVADRFLEQVAINKKLENELLAMQAEYGALQTTTQALLNKLTDVEAAYDTMASAGIVHGLVYHDAYMNAISQFHTDTVCRQDMSFGQVTLPFAGNMINRLVSYTDDVGVEHASTSITVLVSDADGRHGPYGVDEGPYRAMVAARPDMFWIESDLGAATGNYDVYITVPEIRGIGANLISISPIPLFGTTIASVEYLSTSGLYVPVGRGAYVGQTKLYFGAQDFGNGLHLALHTSVNNGDGYIGGAYRLELQQVGFATTAAFVAPLNTEAISNVKAISSFEVDFDVFGLDRSYSSDTCAKFTLWGSASGSGPEIPLSVPVGLTSDMPPIDVATSGAQYFYLVGEFKQYNGATPVYRSCKATYITG